MKLFLVFACLLTVGLAAEVPAPDASAVDSAKSEAVDAGAAPAEMTEVKSEESMGAPAAPASAEADIAAKASGASDPMAEPAPEADTKSEAQSADSDTMMAAAGNEPDLASRSANSKTKVQTKNSAAAMDSLLEALTFAKDAGYSDDKKNYGGYADSYGYEGGHHAGYGHHGHNHHHHGTGYGHNHAHTHGHGHHHHVKPLLTQSILVHGNEGNYCKRSGLILKKITAKVSAALANARYACANVELLSNVKQLLALALQTSCHGYAGHGHHHGTGYKAENAAKQARIDAAAAPAASGASSMEVKSA